MSKIVVEVRIPAADWRADVAIPYEAPLRDTLELLKSAVSEDVRGAFLADESTLLCDAVSGRPLEASQSPQQHGLMNGSRLLLI